MIDNSMIDEIKEILEARNFIELAEICKISLNEASNAVIKYNSVKKSVLKDKEEILEQLVIMYASIAENFKEKRKI